MYTQEIELQFPGGEGSLSQTILDKIGTQMAIARAEALGMPGEGTGDFELKVEEIPLPPRGTRSIVIYAPNDVILEKWKALVSQLWNELLKNAEDVALAVYDWDFCVRIDGQYEVLVFAS